MWTSSLRLLRLFPDSAILGGAHRTLLHSRVPWGVPGSDQQASLRVDLDLPEGLLMGLGCGATNPDSSLDSSAERRGVPSIIFFAHWNSVITSVTGQCGVGAALLTGTISLLHHGDIRCLWGWVMSPLRFCVRHCEDLGNSPRAWCAFGPNKGALCVNCIGTNPGEFVELPAEALAFLKQHAPVCQGTTDASLPIKNCAKDTKGPVGEVALTPCVLCQSGSNSIDHWLSYCPVVHITWVALHKDRPPPINWRQTPTKHIGVALTYLLFHLRRIVTEYGGLRPNIECVKVRAISGHALDLWQRTYQSFPATLLAWFRPPPTQADLHCTSTAHIRVQRFPQTQLEAALLPDKGLCTTKAFKKDEIIATFVTADARLRMLLMQYTRLPFPTATATLLPYTCQCGATHLKLCATEDILDNAVLLLGEASQWKGCLVQFDGSAHKRTRAGGAGVSLLQVTQNSTALVRWKSVPLLNCPDNVVAEAHA